MKIRMKMTVLGTFHGMENVQSGEIVDVPDADGARYCELGYAVPVADLAEGEEHAVIEEHAELRSAAPSVMTTGDAPQTGVYDPGSDNVQDVLAYLEGADEAEVRRVMDAEEAGKARAGLLNKRDELLARLGEAG